MLKTLKFNTKDQGVFFVSDLHWNHNPKWPVPLWKSRGYETLEAHNEHIIDQINKHIKPNDILFSGGDLTLNCSEDDFESFIKRLNCQNIYCLWGNHPNPMAKIYKRELEKAWLDINDLSVSNEIFSARVEVYPFRYKNIVFCGDYLELIIDKQIIVFFHYPLSIFNHQKSLAWCLCGHSHHGFKATLPSNLNGKILDIGWDGYKKPLSFNEIKEIMDKKQYIKIDEHH